MSFTASPLRGRDFRLVVGAKAISFIGDEAAVIALTLGFASHGPWAVAGLLVAGFVPMMLMAPLAGVLVDRHDSRRLLVTTGLLQTAICAMLAFSTSVPIVYALIFLLGAGQAVTAATWSALLPGIVGRDAMARAIGLSQATTNAAMIFAPALGGVLVGVGGTRLVLLIDVGTFLALSVAGRLIGYRRRITPEAAGNDGWRAGVRVILADRILTVLVGMLFAFVLLGGMVNVVVVFLVRYTLHAGPAWYGAEGAVVGLAMVAGSLLSGRVKGEQQLLRGAVASIVLLASSMLGYAFAPTVEWIIPAALVCGLGNALLNVTVNTVVAMRISEEVRGRVSAAIGGLMSGGMAGAMLTGGAVAAVLTPREVFALSGCIGLLIPLVAAPLLLRSAEKEPAALVPAAGPVD